MCGRYRYMRDCVSVSVYRYIVNRVASRRILIGSMRLKMHHPLIPSYIYPLTLTGKPLLPGFRPRPHPDHLCGTVLYLRGATGAKDQV